MSDLATVVAARPPAAALLDKKMKKSHAMISGGVVLAALVIGLGFIAFNIVQDFAGIALGSIWPYALLVVALLIALGFEFVKNRIEPDEVFRRKSLASLFFLHPQCFVQTFQ